MAEEEKKGRLRILAAETYYEAACAAIREIDMGARTVVLVPDSCTLQAERLVLNLLELSGSFNIFVNSFDRLFYFLCGEAKPMPAASAVMLLQKIISENAKKLKCFYRSADFPGFAEKIYGVITKLKSGGIAPADLEKRGGEGALGKKLSDIRLLYEKYEEERGKDFLDQNDRAQKLARFIAEGRAARCNVVLAGFNSLSGTEAGVIKQFLLSGCPVTAAAAHDPGRDAGSGGLYGRLTALADAIRIKPETVFIPPAPRAPVFRHLYDNLERYPKRVAELKNNAVTVTLAPGIYAEAQNAARMIAVYTRRGYRYRDIAVVCPEPEKYIPAIESVFAQYGISCFLSAPQTLKQHPLYSYITAGTEAALKGFALSDVLVFVKNPYFAAGGVCGKDKNVFENYCLRRGTDRGGFFREFTRAGESGTPLEREREEKERRISEAVRLKAVSALQAFSVSRTGSGWAALTESLIGASGDITERLIAASGYRAAEALRQGADGFRAVAAEIARIFGNAPVTPKRFLDVFKRGCGLYTLSSIPETQDCVIVGGPEITRLSPPKILFIMNACEGSLPARETDCGIINDAEIGELQGGGIDITPSVREANAGTEEETFQAAVSPRAALHVSYPAIGADGKPRDPAPLVNSVCALFRKGGAPLAPYSGSGDVFGLKNTADKKKAARLAADVYACTDKVALRSLAEFAGLCRDGGDCGGADPAALYRSLVLRGKITGDGPPQGYKPPGGDIPEADALFFYKGSTKVSQIESFYACPYAHFLEYGLRLKERPEAGPDGANIGTLLHAVLERFVREGMAGDGGEIFDEAAAMPEYAALDDAANAPLRKRLRKESKKVCAVLKEQQKYSLFKPAFFEMDFPAPGAPPLELPVNGGRLKVAGKIDRADVAEADGVKYARVIDYKTGMGGTKLTYGGVRSGISLQLLVYLAALRARGYAPAGAFYFRVHDNGDDYRMNGIVNKERGLPLMMDARLAAPGFKSDIINIASTKTGDFRKSPYAVDGGTLERLCDYALSQMGAAAARIGRGERAVSPYKDACKFCPFGGVCLFNPDRDEARDGGGVTVRTAEELLELHTPNSTLKEL